MRLIRKAFQQRRRDPSLTDPHLAPQEHHLTFASLCFRPAPQQQFKFFFPPDQRGQTAVCSASKRFPTEARRKPAHALKGPPMP